MISGPKKDIIIAIIFGLGTGIIFSYAFFHLTKIPSPFFLKKGSLEKISPSPVQKITIKGGREEISHLIINSPTNEIAVSKPKIVLSGKAPKKSLVFLISEISQQVIDLNDKETFLQEIELAEGENKINVAAVFKDGSQENLTLTLVYQKE